jgi:hypothetical protein
MPSNLLKLATTSAFALSLLAAPVMAQEMFGDWDANADAGIDQEEFNTGFGEAGAFGAWDANDDEGIDQSEFEAGYGDREVGEFSEWDTDADSMLNEDEFNTGVFGSYDADASGVIEEPEFGDVGDDMGDEGLFDI